MIKTTIRSSIVLLSISNKENSQSRCGYRKKATATARNWSQQVCTVPNYQFPWLVILFLKKKPLSCVEQLLLLNLVVIEDVTLSALFLLMRVAIFVSISYLYIFYFLFFFFKKHYLCSYIVLETHNTYNLDHECTSHAGLFFTAKRSVLHFMCSLFLRKRAIWWGKQVRNTVQTFFRNVLFILVLSHVLCVQVSLKWLSENFITTDIRTRCNLLG